MYMNTLLHCHFCIQIITDHFLLNQVSHPIHNIPGINAHLLYPILCPRKYSIRRKLLYCPVCIFCCFHGNQRCVASYHYFYTWGILQEVDIISTVRTYKFSLQLELPFSLLLFCVVALLPPVPIVLLLLVTIVHRSSHLTYFPLLGATLCVVFCYVCDVPCFVDNLALEMLIGSLLQIVCMWISLFG